MKHYGGAHWPGCDPVEPVRDLRPEFTHGAVVRPKCNTFMNLFKRGTDTDWIHVTGRVFTPRARAVVVSILAYPPQSQMLICVPDYGVIIADHRYSLQLVHPAPVGDVLAAFEAYVMAGEDEAAARFILDYWRTAC